MSDADAVLAANAAYYRAFASGDFPAMSGIWAADGVSCIHPGWPALLGRAAILESYRGILHGANRVHIAHRDDVAIIAGDQARVVCVEIVEGAALAATNCYRRVAGAWRMVHHQASPIAAATEESEPPPSARRLN
jgi:ketosteroid isomerase-like protein